jgi:hypothetical protein
MRRGGPFVVSFRRKALVFSMIAGCCEVVVLSSGIAARTRDLLLRLCDPDVSAPRADRKFRRAVLTAVLQR